MVTSGMGICGGSGVSTLLLAATKPGNALVTLVPVRTKGSVPAPTVTVLAGLGGSMIFAGAACSLGNALRGDGAGGLLRTVV